jgi:hypothetical protein
MPNNPDDDEATPTFEKVRLKPNFPSREIEKNFNKIRLREKLTPIEYQVTQEKHTERLTDLKLKPYFLLIIMSKLKRHCVDL